jgi:enoyl-[acyl-carrier protein] reductase II
MRVIRNDYVEEWEEHPEDIQPFPMQAVTSMRAGAFDSMAARLVEDVDPDRVCMPCGQGAGAIREILSCQEIVDEVTKEARETIDRMAGLL